MRTNAAAGAAAVLVGVEGLGLLVLGARQLAALLAGDLTSAPTAVALLVLTAAGAAAVLAFAVGIARGRSWARSGGIVTQVLILSVALGAVTGVYGSPLTALSLAVPAVAALALIVVTARRAAAEASAPESPADGATGTAEPEENL
jgi:hypothetical protein